MLTLAPDLADLFFGEPTVKTNFDHLGTQIFISRYYLIPPELPQNPIWCVGLDAFKSYQQKVGPGYWRVYDLLNRQPSERPLDLASSESSEK